MNWDHCSDLGEEEFHINYLRKHAELCVKNSQYMRLQYNCTRYTYKELFEYAAQQSSSSCIVSDIFHCIIMHNKQN